MKSLCKKPTEAYVLFDRLDVNYFTGLDIEEGALIITKTGKYFLTDARYYHAVEKQAKDKGIVPILYAGLKSIFSLLKKIGVITVYIDLEKTSAKIYQNFLENGFKIESGEDGINQEKSVKTLTELENLKKACEITQSALEHAIKHLKVGVSELEIKEILVSEMKSLGALGESFETIVAFGENSAVPHHKTGNTRLQKDQVVLIDTGANYNGYMGDITRTYFFGEPSKKFIEIYSLVLNANLLAENLVETNIKAKSVDKAVREYFRRNGVEKYFTHSLGHGVGQRIHESPYLSKKSKDILRENSVFTIEPGLYFNDQFGVRIEDTVMIKDKKLVRLFKDDKSLTIIK